MDNNYIESLVEKINLFSNNLNTKSILISLIGIGIMFFILGASQSNLINSHTVVIIMITTIVIYFYIKKSYQKQFNRLKTKNKILKTNSILDDICSNDDLSKKNSSLCKKYKYAKSNFYKISNLLLQNFNIND